MNYGAIGAVIGHEISHGFDDQGRQYDGDGAPPRLVDGRGPRQVRGEGAGLVEAVQRPTRLCPGVIVNGELTLGENIGDLSGVTVAYGAYIRSLDGAEAPVIDGTGDQRFFLGYAQVWRTKWREARLREIILTDPHSPGEFRTNGVVSNMDEFYAAFGVKEGDKLWRPAAERVKIW